MGAACSEGGDAVNREINRQIVTDRSRLQQEVKLLLLGCGESGKSTFFKQIQIMANKLDSDAERWTAIIFRNILDCMAEILEALPLLQIEFSSSKAKKAARRVADFDRNKIPSSPSEDFTKTLEDVETLWADESTKKAFALRGQKFSVGDSAGYLFNNLKRMKAKDFKPSMDDILRSRVMTTGIFEGSFDLNGFSFRLIDVGGQRNERRKWMHCFDDVTALLYFVSLSEYDEKLREFDRPRMKESMELFEELVNSTYFKRVSVILFLNKVDLLEEKLSRVPLTTFFKDFTGDTAEHAKLFIKNRYLDLDASNHTIYPHFTCAVDPTNIKIVWETCRDTIVKNMLHSGGLSL